MSRLVISRWNMIVWESVVLNRTYTIVNNDYRTICWHTDCKQQSLIQKATLIQVDTQIKPLTWQKL